LDDPKDIGLVKSPDATILKSNFISMENLWRDWWIKQKYKLAAVAA